MCSVSYYASHVNQALLFIFLVFKFTPITFIHSHSRISLFPLTTMSLRPKHVRSKKSGIASQSSGHTSMSSLASALPMEIRTTWNLKRAHNHCTLPTVTPRGIIGTYTFSAPPGPLRPPSVDSTPPLPPDTRLPHVPDREINQHFDAAPDNFPSDHLLKTTQQADTWTRKVIPVLVPIYLHLLQTTQSLTRPLVLSDRLCTCGDKVTSLTVSCLYFDCEIFSFLPVTNSESVDVSLKLNNCYGGPVCLCSSSPNSCG